VLPAPGTCANGEAVTSITINSSAALCAGELSDITFTRLLIQFNLDQSPCGGTGTRIQTCNWAFGGALYRAHTHFTETSSCIDASDLQLRPGSLTASDPPIGVACQSGALHDALLLALDSRMVTAAVAGAQTPSGAGGVTPQCNVTTAFAAVGAPRCAGWTQRWP